MVRQWLSIGALAMAMALAGSAHGQDAGGERKAWDELIKAAQREGEVSVILSGQIPEKLRVAMPTFEKKYGVKVKFQTGSGQQHAARILAERRFGRYTLDAWWGGADTPLAELIPNKVLAPMDELLVDPDVRDPSKWFHGKLHYTDPERRFILAWGASPTQFVSFNTNLVNPDEIKSCADLLNPKWKGKIVAWAIGAQGASVDSLVLNPKVGYDWFRRLANEMDMTIVDNPRQGAEWVALGRFPIGLFGLDKEANLLANQGFPIQGWLPHPMKEANILSAGSANLMAIDRAPHPNALKLFVNWALSREAQQQFIEIGEKTDSLRTDVDNSVIGVQNRIQPDAEYDIAFENFELINNKAKIIDNLRKIIRDAGYR